MRRITPLLTLALLPTLASAALTRSAAWTPPTTRENGEPLAASELAEYRLYRVVDGAPVLAASYPGDSASATLPLDPRSCYDLYLTAVDTQALVNRSRRNWRNWPSPRASFLIFRPSWLW